MPEIVADATDLPVGSHTLSLHVGSDEAADHAARFIAGAPKGQATVYWVPDSDNAERCARTFGSLVPDHVGCVAILPHEQVEFQDGRLRPCREALAFLEAHPEGVSAGADTISTYWNGGTIPEHLEYESWFQAQASERSRFLCPYDLRMIPPHLAPTVLRDLGAHHTHVLLSASSDLPARLLQLFVFPRRDRMPESQLEFLAWAREASLVVLHESTGEFALTAAGEGLVRDWAAPKDRRGRRSGGAGVAAAPPPRAA